MTYNVIRYVNMGIKRTELIRKIDLRKGKNKWRLIVGRGGIPFSKVPDGFGV